MVDYNLILQESLQFDQILSEELKYMSLYYSIMGINTTQMKYKKDGHNYYKDPIENNLEKYTKEKQSLEYVIKRRWNGAVGIGATLGWKNLRALDIDGVSIYSSLPFLVKDFLSVLNLPPNYPWITISGSYKGFHILFYCDDIDETFDAKSFSPSDNCLERGFPFFDHIELRWMGHLVLPPSLHKDGGRYRFFDKQLPAAEIQPVKFKDVDLLLQKYCGGRHYRKYKTASGRIFELTEIKKCISRDGSYYTYPKGFRGDSVEWLMSSDTAEAKNALAIHYLIGDGVEKNIAKALDMFQTANCQSSIFNLISLYESGALGLNDVQYGNLWTKLNKNIFEKHIKTFDDKINIRCNVQKQKYIFFDTETTGVPRNYNAPACDTRNWPRLVQLGWVLTDENDNTISSGCEIVKPDGFIIPSNAVNVHGITTEKAKKEGKPLREVINRFLIDAKQANIIVGHNISYDKHVIGAELCRLGIPDTISKAKSICTMELGTDFCKIPGSYGYKWPKLQELYRKLFGTNFEEAHDAMADIKATKKCFFELKRMGVVKN